MNAELDDDQIVVGAEPKDSEEKTAKAASKDAEGKKGKKRHVQKKLIYICEAADAARLSEASTFRVVAGPFNETPEAVTHIKDDLDAGEFVLMYEGKTIRKITEMVTRIEE